MTDWLAGRAEDFSEGCRKILTAGEREVVVLQVQGSFHAYENLCMHMGGPVGEGTIITKDAELYLVCPVHGWRYNAATGVCATDERLTLNKYPVVEREGSIYVVT